MMKTSKNCQLWRVDLIHRKGYHAPYQLIEVTSDKNQNEYKIAHKMASELNLRLLDFPEKWRFTLTKLERFKINGKWIEKEFL